MSNMSYSPYGVMKRVGELYTKSLKWIDCQILECMELKKTMDKAHVITDFIVKGFETGNIDMMTDGTEAKRILYAEDCCAKRWKQSWKNILTSLLITSVFILLLVSLQVFWALHERFKAYLRDW